MYIFYDEIIQKNVNFGHFLGEFWLTADIEFLDFWNCQGRSLSGAEVSHNTGNARGTVLGHQAPLTRPRESPAVAWSPQNQ